jgi:hypothetical protein
MIPRSHFEAGVQEQNAIVPALSGEEAQYAAALNTLKYGSLTRFAKWLVEYAIQSKKLLIPIIR